MLLLTLLCLQNPKHWVAVAALAQQLQALQIDAGIAWQLARKTPVNQLTKPETAQHIKQQADAHADVLGVGRNAVIALTLEGYDLSFSLQAVKARVAKLGEVLQLQPDYAQRLVVSVPRLLEIKGWMVELFPARVDALQQLLRGWTLQQLQAAVAQHGSVLLREPALFQQRWDLIHRYCKVHLASARRLQQELEEPGRNVLRVFTVPNERFKLLKDFLEQQQQQEREESSKGDTDVAASSAMLNLWQVIDASAEEFEQIAWEQPDFKEW
jgi:hypothetical protein